jgi:CHASE2 domain-containing sensor protein
MAMRSHLLLVGFLWPVVMGLIATRNQNTRKPIYIGLAFAIGLVGPVLSLVGVGLANKAVSGEFRMMPWGGCLSFVGRKWGAE